MLSLAVAPVLVILFYIYIRDKYEKEPYRLLTVGLLFGIIITVPIVRTEKFITSFLPITGARMEAFYSSFVVASLVEEGFKYVVLFFLIWRNHNFNERFDGIVYSVFISLGFAGLENILYVFNPQMGGLETALSRAFVSVPGHALFGVCMGYYFALSRFYDRHSRESITNAALAFLVPYFLHGVYDFILLGNFPMAMPVFVAFVVYLWITGFRKMKAHISNSPFKPR